MIREAFTGAMYGGANVLCRVADAMTREPDEAWRIRSWAHWLRHHPGADTTTAVTEEPDFEPPDCTCDEPVCYCDGRGRCRCDD
jgi:hypothetical protein